MNPYSFSTFLKAKLWRISFRSFNLPWWSKYLWTCKGELLILYFTILYSLLYRNVLQKTFWVLLCLDCFLLYLHFLQEVSMALVFFSANMPYYNYLFFIDLPFFCYGLVIFPTNFQRWHKGFFWKLALRIANNGHSLEVDESCSSWTLLCLVSQGSHLEQWQARMSLKTQFTVSDLLILS